jgi:hypothetical protein
MTDLPTLSVAEAALLARIADEAIPRSGALPSASEVGVHGHGFARYAALLPQKAARVLAALRNTMDVEDGARSSGASADDFRTIAEAAAGIYLTDPRVMALFGYQGRVPLPLVDPEGLIQQYAPLVAPVVARGWVWKDDDTDHASLDQATRP